MPSFGGAIRSFWHAMTSNDRHASFNSPYRTGQHVPLNQSRHAPLTSVATSAMESRPDLNSSYNEDPSSQFTPALQNGSIPAPGTPGAGTMASPASPYSPGMRSSAALQKKNSNEVDPFDKVTTGEIQMQNFQDGAPPPPPAQHSWKKIDRWAEENYEELYDQLSEGATQNDVHELEHELDISLPVEVRESLQTHDGQERGGRPTGIIFGCMLLDCEEIVQEWRNWKVVNEEYLSPPTSSHGSSLPKAFAGPSSAFKGLPQQQSSNPLWRQQLLERQESLPPRAIQRAYAHPNWIPLARDWGGNNLAVDLAPGPLGTWGQVIIFGRDYDCKYVVARSWAAFLATVADDLQSGRWFVDEETQELKLREFKTTTVEPGYLDILRWRMDQKYGRRGPRRKPGPGPGSPRLSNASGSPYGSPTDERGRSPQRYPSRTSQGSLTSPTAVGKPSPLGMVTEENTLPRLQTGMNKNSAGPDTPGNLMELNTPVTEEAPKHRNAFSRVPTEPLVDSTNGQKSASSKVTGLGVDGVGDMKNVDI